MCCIFAIVTLLSAKLRENRLNFCLAKQNWTVADWRNILWSDESSFELFHPTNRQNYRIWAKNSLNIMPLETVKFLPEIHGLGDDELSSYIEITLHPSQTDSEHSLLYR